MRLYNKVQVLKVLNQHLIAYPTPANLNWSWNWGSLAGLLLSSQIITGILLGMHYVGHVDYAFSSVQHLMTDVPSGMILRYAHANGASLFFTVVYLHILRGIYYSSGNQPREMVWITGVVILLAMIITAFIGYVLPWGQIGLKCLMFSVIGHPKKPAERTPNRILPGPHNLDVVSLFFGSLLGDCYAEQRSGSKTAGSSPRSPECRGSSPRTTTRFQMKQSSMHVQYLFWFHSFLADRGYCDSKKPVLKTFIGKNDKIYHSYRLSTFSSASFNWIYDSFYMESTGAKPLALKNPLANASRFQSTGAKPLALKSPLANASRFQSAGAKPLALNSPLANASRFHGIKRIPLNLEQYLTPFALALWIMQDGGSVSSGLRLATHSLTVEDVTRLCLILHKKYDLKCTVHLKKEGPTLYIWAESMPILRNLVLPYMLPSMHSKLKV